MNAAWAKMKALEAKLEADELKATSLEDAKSELVRKLVRKLVSGKQWPRRIQLKNERKMARIQQAKAEREDTEWPLGQRARKA